MARIRTIKPDFWTDEKLVECSTNARLLFIGTWNFSDDNGNLPRSSKKLKMQIFPSDNIDCEKLVLELLRQGVMIEYEVDDEKYLHIKGFTKHQKIDRPSKSQLPEFKPDDNSSNTHRVIDEPSPMEGKGMESNGREVVDSGASLKAPQPPASPKIEFYLGEKNEAAIPDRQVVPIHSDFDPSDEWGEYAARMGFVNGKGQLELEKFIAYWTVGKGAGKRKSKRGWRQAWANWLDISARRM